MLQIKTYANGERATIYCYEAINYGKVMFLVDVIEIDGSVDVAKYYQRNTATHLDVKTSDIMQICGVS